MNKKHEKKIFEINPVKNMKPIEIWKTLIQSELNENEMKFQLEEIYRDNRPSIAEIIMNSHCPNRCLHCIYPPDYDRYNINMGWEEWKTAFRIIFEKLGLKRFIFDGRALTRECIQAVSFLKEKFPGVKVGLIADGVSLEPFVNDLIHCPPDWLDVSVDGDEEDHDRQRNHKGAYRKTLDILTQLRESDSFERINILTCLTTLNLKSATGMIRNLNAMGFKNFFITPMSILNGYRPPPGLRPESEDFVQWLDELLEVARTLSDSWVEVDIYEAPYAGAIKQIRPDLFNELAVNDDHITTVRQLNDNELHVSYYPYSLTGIRELIVNSDGNLMPTNVMAMGKIPNELIFGNILDKEKRGSLLKDLYKKNAFSYYVEQFLKERSLLG